MRSYKSGFPIPTDASHGIVDGWALDAAIDAALAQGQGGDDAP